MLKLDRRREYYMILDCETATLPCAANYPDLCRKNIAIAKPLIYDLGWTIIDRQGRVYDKRNYLITEIFSVPSVFNTAYYAEKRPIYLDMLNRGEIILTDWRTAAAELVEAISAVAAVGAYNSMFDFKKAIPFTELYINELYSPDFHKWLAMQEGICKEIAFGKRRDNPNGFDGDNFCFRGNLYPLFDVWGLACKYLLNNDDFRAYCTANRAFTASGKYYSTTAENAFRFLNDDDTFNEAHTALDDALIESEIFSRIVGGKRGKDNLEIGIIYFPFRIIGRADM